MLNVIHVWGTAECWVWDRAECYSWKSDQSVLAPVDNNNNNDKSSTPHGWCPREAVGDSVHYRLQLPPPLPTSPHPPLRLFAEGAVAEQSSPCCRWLTRRLNVERDWMTNTSRSQRAAMRLIRVEQKAVWVFNPIMQTPRDHVWKIGCQSKPRRGCYMIFICKPRQ